MWRKLLPAALLLAFSSQAQSLASQNLASVSRTYRQEPTAVHQAAVVQYANSHKDASGALAFLALGSKQVEQHDTASAVRSLEAASKHLPPILADYRAYLLAVVRFESGNYGDVERELKLVWDRTPSSPLAGKAAILLANAYLKMNEPKQAQLVVERYAGELKPWESEILAAHAADLAGNRSAAMAHYARVLTDFPLSPEGADAESDPSRVASLPFRARLIRALNLLNGGSPRALKEYESLLPQLSGADLDLARVKIGAARVAARSYNPAFEYLRALKVSSPEPDAERLYWIGRCARRLDRAQEVTQTVRELGAAHLRSQWYMQALLSAGDMFWLQNSATGYEPLYRTCAASFSGKPEAAECQWRVAWAAYQRREADAETQLRALVQTYPSCEYVATALYFLARIAEAKGDLAAARAFYEEINNWYSNFFYATLARQRLAEPRIAKVQSSPAALAFLKSVNFPQRAHNENFSASPSMRARVERAKLLASGGLDDLAESELRFGAKRDGQPEVAAYELAELAAERDAPNIAIRYIKTLAPGYLRLPIEMAPERFWKLAYPLPFREELESSARAQALDPFMVAALVRQESEFNPKVVSHANAYGLTQLLPSTGRSLGRKLNLPILKADMLFKPDINLRIGTFFLRSLLDNLQGRWEAVLAAYNAGPSRAATWLTWGSFREPAEFIETIPFDETRNYVQSVLRNADMYRRLYGPKAVALASSNGDTRRKDTGSPGASHQ